ncbi:MAG: bifunctional 4-hydroxy-2-oxoglutarate aldolase/2-dehydro-3-deoxy-phosphogluconate aldolase, partial [Spirochaetales bacterium]|nr:bifunctional 4-hydroxy-2-oxoglutarate aldolase/2-dehydro-3-deoxy-phosphogluconate aldolase [Spirochaetales bacterium]
MDDVLKSLGEAGIIPVVKIENSSDSENLADALIAGGLPVAEITFRTDAAEDSIRIISKKFPEMIVGAGTVLAIEQVKQAVGAGAQFIVAPGFNPRVVEYCIANGIIIIPGVNSATQIEIAMEAGLEILKFFPAEASGGIGMIKGLSGPYGTIKFIPTGGINIGNLSSYLGLKAVHACGGSWMVPPELIAQGKFDEISRLSREAVSEVLGFAADSINRTIMLRCNSLVRSAGFLKKSGFEVDYDKSGEEIILVRNYDGLRIVLKEKLN